jgi:hypothetical protein
MRRGALSVPALQLLLLLAIAAHTAALRAQTQASVNPTGRLEVASIKPSKPGAVVQDARLSFPPGRFEAINVTLNDLLYSLNGFTGRVEGARSGRNRIVTTLLPKRTATSHLWSAGEWCWRCSQNALSWRFIKRPEKSRVRHWLWGRDRRIYCPLKTARKRESRATFIKRFSKLSLWPA